MTSPTPNTDILTATSQRRSSALFNYINIAVMVLAGIPLIMAGNATGKGMILATAAAIIPIVLWFGGSMLLYALNKHHPNPKVGHYTQWAAYRYYAVTGSLIVIGTFFPADVRYYLAFWAFAAGILVPWSIWEIMKIQRDTWADMPMPAPHVEHFD
ncbi:MAG: hypothetical protein B7Y40_07590 [Gammaproteobacteria bacterium 28-57-27]|nr:MAG: hypothetical protein B7Y40_07590 [Gammaproteobacteria bacterium 28-57-27]